MKKFLIIFILLIINFINIVYAKESSAPDIKKIESIESKFAQYVKKSAPFVVNAEEILEQHGYLLKYKQDKNDIKIDLLDGDFVVIKSGVPYMAEYHADGTIMGMIRVKFFNKDDNNVFSFYEYRSGYNIQSGMGLKHIVFLTPNKNNRINQYLFNNKGTLLCYQDDEENYISPNINNMLINLSSKQTRKYIKHVKKVFKKYENKANKLPENVQSYIKNITEVPVFVVMFTYCLILMSF